MRRMISIISAFVILFFASGAFSEEYTRAELKNKLAGFTRMQTGGTVMLVAGITLDCLGPFLLINGITRMVKDVEKDMESDYYSDTYTPDGFIQMEVGVYALGFGIPLTVAGSVLKAIGGKKAREYKSRLKKVSFDISPNKVSVLYDF